MGKKEKEGGFFSSCLAVCAQVFVLWLLLVLGKNVNFLAPLFAFYLFEIALAWCTNYKTWSGADTRVMVYYACWAIGAYVGSYAPIPYFVNEERAVLGFMRLILGVYVIAFLALGVTFFRGEKSYLGREKSVFVVIATLPFIPILLVHCGLFMFTESRYAQFIGEDIDFETYKIAGGEFAGQMIEYAIYTTGSSLWSSWTVKIFVWAIGAAILIRIFLLIFKSSLKGFFPSRV